MFLFILYLFNVRSLYLIDDIFKEIGENLVNNEEHQSFYNKFRNVGVYIFCSTKKKCIFNDLVDMNEKKNILNLLKGKWIYILRQDLWLDETLRSDNKDLRRNLDEILTTVNNSSPKKIKKMKSMGPYESSNERNFFFFNKKILKKQIYQKIKSKYIEPRWDFENRRNLLLIISNMILDNDIFLILFKALNVYRENLSSRDFKYFNFMVLNFENIDNKKEFNEDFKMFYYLKMQSTKFYHKYFISPFIIAEFKEDVKRTPSFENSILPEFRIRSMFEEDYRWKNLRSKEDLEFRNFKHGDWVWVSKRSGTILNYYDDSDEENRKLFKIYGYIFNIYIKFISKSRDEILGIKKEGYYVYKRISTFSVFVDEALIQEINIISFYIYEKKDTKKYLKIDEYVTRLNEIILTEDIYEGLKSKIFLLMKPGINLFYFDRYINYDFLRGDFIFFNKNIFSGIYKFKCKTLDWPYKYILEILLSFANENSDKYEVYTFDITYQENINLKNSNDDFNFENLKGLSNVKSFKKKKYEHGFYEEKILNSEDIMILFENKTEMQNSFYIYLGVKETIYNLFEEYYFNLFCKEIENDEALHPQKVYQLELSNRELENLNEDIKKGLNIFYEMIRDSNNRKQYINQVIRYKYHEDFIRSCVDSISKDLYPESSLYSLSRKKVLTFYILRINKLIYWKIFRFGLNRNKDLKLKMCIFTSSFYSFKDIEEFQIHLSKLRKYADVSNYYKFLFLKIFKNKNL